MTTELRLELLERLTEARGVPGYEDEVRAIVRDELAAVADRVSTDAMGNVVGTVEGSGDFEVLVAAHMDEIGFMVREVDEDGFARIDALGGWDPRILKSQRVTVHADEEDLVGVIGSMPPHLLDDDEAADAPELDDIYVDLGMDGEEAAERVGPGDLVTLDQTTVRMGELVTGKALDDRSCVFAMLEAAARIEDPPSTIHFAATVQEEVGLRGARALGADVDPDLAIALDVTIADDVPDAGANATVTELGEGTAIKLKDASVITSPKVHRRIRALADDRDIPYQLEVLPSGGTDTAAFQVVGGATPVGAISIPTRYLHTATEAAHLGDVEATVDLLVALLQSEDGSNDYAL
ncbi:MAG: M42 family metallopeptidase [Halobacteriales archaeon]